MKIYHFVSWCENTYKITEIEVEEKPKTYIERGKYSYNRILKDDINKLGRYGDMYCLSPDPTIYIDAMIARAEVRVKAAQAKLRDAEEDLKKWNEIKGGAQNGRK